MSHKEGGECNPVRVIIKYLNRHLLIKKGINKFYDSDGFI